MPRHPKKGVEMQTSQNEALFQIPLRRIDGTSTSLADFAGKVLLIVNVASECGLTPQYEGLEALYETYRAQGFEVLGFPANEFGAQEPGTNDEIALFCKMKYGVKFPMFEKIVVKGVEAHPLYVELVKALPESDALGDDSFAQKLAEHGVVPDRPSDVTWNFEKFLVDRAGTVVARFAPSVAPDQPAFRERIEHALAART
jgi:glutathione peroxidase